MKCERCGREYFADKCYYCDDTESKEGKKFRILRSFAMIMYLAAAAITIYEAYISYKYISLFFTSGNIEYVSASDYAQLILSILSVSIILAILARHFSTVFLKDQKYNISHGLYKFAVVVYIAAMVISTSQTVRILAEIQVNALPYIWKTIFITLLFTIVYFVYIAIYKKMNTYQFKIMIDFSDRLEQEENERKINILKDISREDMLKLLEQKKKEEQVLNEFAEIVEEMDSEQLKSMVDSVKE